MRARRTNIRMHARGAWGAAAALALFFCAASAFATVPREVAGDPAGAPADSMIRDALSQRYPGARIDLFGEPRWTVNPSGAHITSIAILDEAQGSEAHFVATAGSLSYEGWIGFAAMIDAPVAVRRIFPGEKLSAALFKTQPVNLASGEAHVYRGVILPKNTDFATLETRQSILEGQFAMSTAVERVPDVRRGDSVKVEVDSGALSLTTMGTAAEPGYVDGPVRVLTAKTKREFVGKLLPGGLVEVKL